MSLIAFTQSMIGILFVIRTLHVFRARALIHPLALSAIGVGTLVCFSLITFFVPGSVAARATLACAITSTMPLSLLGLERRRVATFKARVPLFLDRWILNLRLGKSVASAREDALRDECADVRALLRPVFDATSTGGRTHLFLGPVAMRELEQIARTSHAALERLESLRHHLREAADFRRKSGQAVRQAVIQSAVMLVMLGALSIFTVYRYGWAHSGEFVTGAVALSLIGTALMARLARKSKWTL